jgi:hypothetical protein
MASKTARFQHPPLNTPRMIRILDLLPSTFKWSSIQATLQTVSLDGGPIYEALSYTWGTDDAVHQIQCNGQVLDVRPNLFNALKRLRYRTKPRALWIDAICINQVDNDEKNQQIPLMRDIYVGAKRALVWLGEETNNSSKAMNLVRRLCKIDESEFDECGRALLFRESSNIDRIPGCLRNVLDELTDIYWDEDEEGFDDPVFALRPLSTVYLPPRGDKSWAALRDLLNRPWFSRIWVIQEVVVARETVMICGSHVLPWKFFKGAAKRMARSYPEEAGGRRWMNISAISGVLRLHRRSRRQANGGADDDDDTDITDASDDDDDVNLLLALLVATLHTDATNPMDKMYGLYGLIESWPGSSPPDSIRVDYGMKVEDLYRNVAQFLISEDRGLFLLQMHGSEKNLQELPSWVPDWSVPKSIGWMLVSMSSDDQVALNEAGNQAAISKTKDKNELVLGAKRLDVLGWAGMVVKQGSDKDKTVQSMEAALKDWVPMVASVGDIKSQAPNGSKAEAFWRTIIADMNGMKKELTENYDAYFATWLARLGLEMDLPGLPNGMDESIDPIDVEGYISDATRICTDRRLCMTVAGSLCLAPANAEEGDIVVFFLGGETPFVVRENGPFYTFVGPCYMHGLNLVDTVNDKAIVVEDIVLR